MATIQKVTFRNLNRFTKPVRQRKITSPTHQLTGYETGGTRVFMMGTLKSMEGRKKYYREHGGYDLVISERVQDNEGLTAREMY